MPDVHLRALQRGTPVCVSVPSRLERISERSKPLALSSAKYGPISPSGVTEQELEALPEELLDELEEEELLEELPSVDESPPPQLAATRAPTAPPIRPRACRRLMGGSSLLM